MSTELIYNTLPTLGEADERFTGRQGVFERLAPLLARHQHEFGVCLVHAHCLLGAGERMLSTGNVSRPARVSVAYPERWLSSGEPYEFSSVPTPTPPAELVRDFLLAVGEHADVLGLCCAGDVVPGIIRAERTDGRQNVTEDIPANGDMAGYVETAWIPGTKDPVKMGCFMNCAKRMTRKNVTHTGYKTHEHLNGPVA